MTTDAHNHPETYHVTGQKITKYQVSDTKNVLKIMGTEPKKGQVYLDSQSGIYYLVTSIRRPNATRRFEEQDRCELSVSFTGMTKIDYLRHQLGPLLEDIQSLSS